MDAVPAGDRAGQVEAIMVAIREGGLFVVDVDIVPTQIGSCAHVMLPAATAGEANLTSMNGERRMRLTERYMDPPGRALPDSLIVAKLAQALEASWRAAGKADVADKFKGYDWKTEEDAFMDGYHQQRRRRPVRHLRAAARDGHQRLPGAGAGFQDGKIVGTKRLFADGKFNAPDGRAKFAATPWRGLAAPGKAEEQAKFRFLINNGRANAVWQSVYLDQHNAFVHDRFPLALSADASRRTWRSWGCSKAIWRRSTTTTAARRRWSGRRRRRGAARPSCCSPSRPAWSATW